MDLGVSQLVSLSHIWDGGVESLEFQHQEARDVPPRGSLDIRAVISLSSGHRFTRAWKPRTFHEASLRHSAG